MEQNNLIIAVDVPYQVEISATGIPLHQSKVEFCIHKEDIRFSFPAKMINDDTFIFTLTDEVSFLLNSTLEYRLYVYYGNARFEADTGTFNFVDKDSFEVDMKKRDAPEATPVTETLIEKLDKFAKVPEEKIDEKPEPTPDEVIEESAKGTEVVEEETVEEVVVTATEPVPTPTITPTLTAKEAKRALKNIIKEKEVKRAVKKAVKAVKEESKDYNQKIKDVLEGLSKKATPSIDLEATPSENVSEAQAPGQFFAEVEKMREINERRRKNKKIREAVKKSRTSKPKKKE